MATQSKSLERVRFDAFEFDLRSGELRRNGTSLNLQPQPAKVLAILVTRAAEIVTRQELAEQVWGSETFVDFEQGLNYAVRQIRTALADDADHPRYLETLPRRGYRFIAEVENLSQPTDSSPPAAASRDRQLAENELKTPTRSRTIWIAVAAGCVLLLTIALFRYWHLKSSADNSAAPIRSIAVLPLANLSADSSQEYFSDGLTDELITELAKIGNLRVISHTSVMGFKGARKRVPEIGRDLRVDAIVEGTVERAGNRVRIRAQLIHAGTDQHLWAESFDRDVKDLLALEREVAREIAQQIGYHISQPVQANSKVAVPAHEDYLRGRYHWNKRTESGLRTGIAYFQKAIDQEPNYALAYAGLADSFIMLANWGFEPPGDAYLKAKAAARKALELDNHLAEAQTSLAYATLLYDWDWETSENLFRRAIALNPNYASAHHFYSILLMAAGRQSEAVAEIKRALEIDPLSLIINDVLGWVYYEGRQYEQAIEQYRATLQMDPNYAPALLDEGSVHMKLGHYNKAVENLQKARAITGDNGVVLSSLAQAYALSGNRAAAQRILWQVQAADAKIFMSEWDLSLIYLSLGEKQKAIELLGKAADKRVGWIIRLRVDPAFDMIRAEPAFQLLLVRVRVPTSRPN